MRTAGAFASQWTAASLICAPLSLPTRVAVLPACRRLTGCRTLALYAYWHGPNLPDQPCIEAGTDAWYWGVPLPDGSYNTLVFVDAEQLRGITAGSLATRFHALIDRSGLMTGCADARLAGPVRAADATPYIDDESVTSLSIKIGDAALAIDPLSSSGVQKAIQTALAGAVVNTLLRRPEARDAALHFFQESLSRAAAQHCDWAAAYYGAVAKRPSARFWQARATVAASRPPPSPDTLGTHPLPEALVELSPQLEFVDLPCIEGEFVTVKSALCHPALDGPLAYLGGWELAPLLRQLRPGMTPLQVALSWSPRVPLRSGLALAGWLVGNGILVQQADGRRARLLTP